MYEKYALSLGGGGLSPVRTGRGLYAEIVFGGGAAAPPPRGMKLYRANCMIIIERTYFFSAALLRPISV